MLDVRLPRRVLGAVSSAKPSTSPSSLEHEIRASLKHTRKPSVLAPSTGRLQVVVTAHLELAAVDCSVSENGDWRDVLHARFVRGAESAPLAFFFRLTTGASGRVEVDCSRGSTPAMSSGKDCITLRRPWSRTASSRGRLGISRRCQQRFRISQLPSALFPTHLCTPCRSFSS